MSKQMMQNGFGMIDLVVYEVRITDMLSPFVTAVVGHLGMSSGFRARKSLAILRHLKTLLTVSQFFKFLDGLLCRIALRDKIA